MTLPIRFPYRALAPAVLVLASLVPSARAAVRVLESDERHVIVELTPGVPTVETLVGEDGRYVRIRFDGAGMTEDSGRPELPVGSFQVGLPPGARPSLRVLGQQWSASRPGAVTPLPVRVAVRDPFGADRVVEERPEAGPAYRSAGRYPAQPFVVGEERDLRGLTTVDILWHGAQAETGTDSYRVLESARLEIVFNADPARVGAPSSRLIRDVLWQRTRRGAVINADVARGWLRAGPGDAPSVGNSPWGGGSQVKVRIDVTGPARLRYADLAAAGFPAGVPIAQVSVYQRTFDLAGVDDPAVAAVDLFAPIPVPSLVQDGNSNGIFDGSDAVVFFGRSFRDQWMTSGFEHEDRFQTSNHYFVRADPAGGARMVQAPAQPASAAADSLPWTPSVVFREEDRRYHDRPADFGLGNDAFESEFFYWNNGATPTGGETGWSFTDPFSVVDPVPGRDAAFVARVCGGGRPGLNIFSNIVTFSVNGTQIGEDSFYNNNLYAGSIVLPDRVLWSHTLPAAALLSGTNTFGFRGRSYQGSSTSVVWQVARFLFDWYEITYDRALQSRNDTLRLSTSAGTAAEQRIRVRGFGGMDVLLFNITDPAAPVAVAVSPAQVVPGTSGTFDLRFGHDNAVAPGEYVAVRDASVPVVGAAALTPVAPSSLLGGGVGARWVAVAYDDFVAPVLDLAAHRSARNTTLVAPLSQVWDVFGNGARDPRALKAYAAYGYHRWTDPLAFLLLVGDACEDHRGVTVEADVDYVPSHSLYATYEGAPEESDQYFGEVTRPVPGIGTFDDLADIYVGRLPVGSVDETAWNVERIVRYETEDLDAPWRRRVLFLADDAFSGSLGGGLSSPYGYVDFERGFCRESFAYADSLARHPYEALLPEVLCMADLSHPCDPQCYTCSGCDPDTISTWKPTPQDPPQNCVTPATDCGFWFRCRTSATVDPNEWLDEYSCMRESMKAAVLPDLRERLSDGVLIWNYQGHANRFFLAHEEIWRDDPIAARHDVETLTNFGRPFIFLGFACHLAEFDRPDERVNEDCMSEKLMNVRQFGATQPGGAIASFSSSGFEFLGPNLTFNQHVMDAFFFPEKARGGALDGDGATLPPGEAGSYRWTLGESTTRARLMHQNDYPSTGNTRQASQRFVLLGDPALEPNVGSPALSVTINGLPVEDPDDGYFLDPQLSPGSVTVVVTATDGRGITAMRVADSARGEVPVSAFQLAVNDSTADGVAFSQSLSYTFVPRAEDYALSFLAVDASGAISTFTLSVTNRFEFSGGEPAAYPSPFQDETSLVYRLTNQASSVRISVYTVTGRKLRDLDGESLTPNQQHRVRWDGRDESGQPVANGTYFLRFAVVSADGRELSRTVPVVKIR